MINSAIKALVDYALERRLIEPCETVWAINNILGILKLDAYSQPTGKPFVGDLADILNVLLDDAHKRGVLQDNSVTARDLLDSELMGRLTPRPAQVQHTFEELYREDPQKATDWYYRFSRDTNYIRTDRTKKDMHWQVQSEYGALDISINLSKPEKDPKAIAAARDLPVSDYPRCQLCVENEGYAGRMNHPARQNHRMVPITVNGAQWFLQYSPYVYYNEHCICLSAQHTPMQIDRSCFEKLLDFVRQFPHYFVGANADLPIVGGSILAHDHFQGGRYIFAMERSEIETPFAFRGFEDIQAGIVRWPMSVIRLTAESSQRLAELADRILSAWRGYTDEESMIFARTDEEAHNTITPIARRRNGKFELDLVLRNNLTTSEYPLGLFHPHRELHHIKKENIGLIEVMGLAILPARLKEELAAVAEALVSGADLRADPRTEKHAEWALSLYDKYAFTAENAMEIVLKETGLVFVQVLEHAGVFKRTPEGQAGFMRFLKQI